MISSPLMFTLYFLTGLILGSLSGVVIIRIFPVWIVKNIGLSLVFPSAMVAFLLPLFLSANGLLSFPFIQGILSAPLAILPCVARYLTLPPGTSRVAMGLGAEPILRFQKIFLPLLALPFALSVLLTVFMLTLCLAVSL